jgi:hypothetical protein
MDKVSGSPQDLSTIAIAIIHSQRSPLIDLPAAISPAPATRNAFSPPKSQLNSFQFWVRTPCADEVSQSSGFDRVDALRHE